LDWYYEVMDPTSPGILDEPPINFECLLVTGDRFVDTYHIQCGFPLNLFLIYWLVIFFMGIIVAKISRKVWVFPAVVICGFVIYLFINIKVVSVGIDHGYILKREFWGQVSHLILSPIFGY